MLYLGLDRQYESEVHTILFSRDYRRNLEEISGEDRQFGLIVEHTSAPVGEFVAAIEAHTVPVVHDGPS